MNFEDLYLGKAERLCVNLAYYVFVHFVLTWRLRQAEAGAASSELKLQAAVNEHAGAGD